MGKVGLPWVEERKDRRGRVSYYCFIRRGILFGMLPGKPGEDEFNAEYQRLKAETEPKPSNPAAGGQAAASPYGYPRGTFGALVADFLASGQFKEKKPRTQGEYRRIAELLQAEHGNKRVAHIERRHVRQIRDAKAETPGAANNELRMMKILLNFAVDDGLIKASPAAKFKELKVGEWRAWTDEECAKFEKKWAPGTMQRRAYSMALYTGQRKQDQITRTRAHRKDAGKGESKTDYMGRFIMALKALADDYDLLMICCAHPPKDGVEKRLSKSKLLTLNDGADTAHWGNKADIGFCVWRRGLGDFDPTYLHGDKLKDHETMGKPFLAELVLNQFTNTFRVNRMGYHLLQENEQ